MKQPKKIRKRKVYYEYYPTELHIPHPLIRISGKYLEHFGFKAGDQIKVEFDMGKIVIEKGDTTGKVIYGNE
jgi:formylmethanofuran dehydrogenase subunit D